MRDIRDRMYFSIHTKEQFESSLFETAPPTYVGSLPLNNNQWTYLNNAEAVQIKTDNTKEAWVKKSLGKLRIGDIINVSVEVFNISGTKAKISISEPNSVEHEVSSVKSNEWETLNLKYVVRSYGDHKLYIGIWRSDIGEFMMRNIRCEVLTQEKTQSSSIESGTNSLGSYVKFSDGTMICRGKITKNGTIEQAWGTLFYIEFADKLYPMEFISPPEVTFSCTSDKSFFVASYYNTSQSTNEHKRKYTPRVDGYRAVKDATPANHEVSYIAIGKWK